MYDGMDKVITLFGQVKGYSPEVIHHQHLQYFLPQTLVLSHKTLCDRYDVEVILSRIQAVDLSAGVCCQKATGQE